jgi:beta-lactamase superfamily II metal-dependent hydrolase
MGRVRTWPLVFLSLALGLILASGCSDDTNPFDPAQDQDPPVVTSFSYSDGVVTWTTNEPALCVVEYTPVGEDFYHYVYETPNVHESSHSATLLGMEDGEEYAVRVRSMDRAGNEAYETDTELPASITGVSFDGDTMTLSMIDVGWGLAMVLTGPSGGHMMIDAGSVSHLDGVITFLDEHGIDAFEAAAVTHHHGDHYGGYVGETDDQCATIVDPGVMDLYWIGDVILPDEEHIVSNLGGCLLYKINEYNFPVTYVKQGDSSSNTDALQWDSTPGFSVQVLSAGVGMQSVGYEGIEPAEPNGNNDSIVFKFNFHDVSYITMADGEFFVEHYIIDYYGRSGVDADLLQVAHHANDDATSTYWLSNVLPRIGFISNAMVEAPLEKEIVLDALRRYDADYFVTDRIFPNTSRNAPPDYGNLIATTDGSTIEVMLEAHDW